MNDPVRVQVLQCLDDLQSVALHLKLMESLPSLKQFIHTLVLAEFQQDVYIFSVFKEVLEETDIAMFDGTMDLDFTH